MFFTPSIIRCSHVLLFILLPCLIQWDRDTMYSFKNQKDKLIMFGLICKELTHNSLIFISFNVVLWILSLMDLLSI